MLSKKNQDIEIGRNSSIYFAIGLNLMLLLSWRAIEYKTYEKNETKTDITILKYQPQEEEKEEDIPIVRISKLELPPLAPAVFQENIKIVENDAVVEEAIFESTEANQSVAIVERVQGVAGGEGNSTGIGVNDIYIEKVDEDVEVPFAIIEDVPIFPGCEGKSKEATKLCFQQKVQEHIVKNFNYPQSALDLGISGRVTVIFTIDSKGYITNIKSRGPDRILEKESERIVSLLPKMTPGKQRGKPVKVVYAIPIFFKYQNR